MPVLRTTAEHAGTSTYTPPPSTGYPPFGATYAPSTSVGYPLSGASYPPFASRRSTRAHVAIVVIEPQYVAPRPRNQ